jgi:hypothetical protein
VKDALQDISGRHDMKIGGGLQNFTVIVPIAKELYHT